MANMGEALSEDEVQVMNKFPTNYTRDIFFKKITGHDRRSRHGRRRQYQLRRVLRHGQQVARLKRGQEERAFFVPTAISPNRTVREEK